MIKRFDLEERTTMFSGNIIALCKLVRPNEITRPIISQLIRAATSVGANYVEANNASSKRDFRNKIYICKKECQETKYWLKLLKLSVHEIGDQAEHLWQEVHELNLIFQRIISSTEANLNLEKLKN